MAQQVRRARGAMSQRLEYVRNEFTSESYSLAEFHRLLGGKDFVSYQTVQNYHFDRDASVQYLAAVAEEFAIRLEWLATGKGSPSIWGTPGTEGEIDSLVHHHLTDPEEKELSAAYEARISETKFLGPLTETIIDNIVSAFTSALDERRSFEGVEAMTVSDWQEKDIPAILALDRILAETWESALSLLGRELGIEPGDLTIDQQIRFAQGVILAMLALLPERDLPVAN